MFASAYIYLLAAGFAFLPFTKAFTIDAGFPLKMYEVAFAAAVLAFFAANRRIDRIVLTRLLVPLLFFIFVAGTAYFYARYDASDFSDVAGRGGAALDGAFRLVYCIFNVAVMVVSYQGTRQNGRLLYAAWQTGMVIAAFYSLYCAYSLTREGEAFLLPGLERHQIGEIGPITVSRSGTFEEGNFAGLYFMASFALAIWRRHLPIALIAIVGLILTNSTSGYLGFILCMGAYGILTSRNLAKNTAVLFLLVASAGGALAYFAADGKFEYRASSSGGARLNEVMTGIEMFRDHPLIGVGLGGYGFSYYRYQWEPDLSVEGASERRIPGNIYVETLAETGVLGFFFFFLFWSRWYGVLRTASGNAKIFEAFALAMFVTWFAYPTFNISFIWCFAGVSLALHRARAARLQNAAAARMMIRRNASLQSTVELGNRSPQSI